MLLVSEAHRVVQDENRTYSKLELGGKWDHIPELLDPHCDETTASKTN